MNNHPHPTHTGPLTDVDPDLRSNLEELAVLRVSARSLQKLANVEENGRRLLDHVRSIQYLDQLPEDLLDDTPRGQTLRAEHGVVPLLRRHASPYADQPNAVMGYLVPAPPDGVVVFIHDSAAEGNVIVPGDPLPRVAFAEFLVTAFATYPSLAHCYFPEWARWIRDEHPAQRIKEASQRFGVTLWNGQRAVDLVTASGTLITGVEGSNATGERRNIRRRTTVGTLNALTAGKKKAAAAWPYAHRLLPLGYDLPRNERGDFVTIGEGKTRWRLIRVAPPTEVAALRRMLQLVAQGAPWADCAKPLVEANIRCRGQLHAGLTYDRLTRSQLATAARSTINEANLKLWESGWYERDKHVPIPTDGDLDGYPVVPRHGTFGLIEIRSYFGLPENGFLDPATAAQIRARLRRREPKDGDQDSHVALLAYCQPYRDTDDDAFTHERRIVRNGDNYTLRERGRKSSFDSRGNRRGWSNTEGTSLLTVRCKDLEAGLGHALAAALTRIATQLAPLQLRERPAHDPNRQLSERIKALETERDQHRTDGKAADRLATASINHDPAGALRHSANATDHFQAAAAIEVRIAELRTELANLKPAETGHGVIDLTNAATLAGLLIGYAGNTAPLEVNQALRQLGLDTLRLQVDPDNSRRVTWTLTLSLPLLDGTTAELPLHGVVRNRRRDQSAAETEAQLTDALARDFLHDAMPLDALADRYTIPRARVVDLLRSWLASHQVRRRGLRGAIVDLPAELTETRLALWSALTGDQDAAQHLARLRTHLAHTYLRDINHPNAWVRRECGLARRALRAMVDALPASGADGVDIGDLARVVGATETEIHRLCGNPDSSGRTDGRYVAVLVRDPLNRRIVRMRPCPHPDCPAAPGHRWLSHYLPVPETDGHHGLICPTCMRLGDPALADLTLPASYLEEAWDGPANPSNFDLGAGPATVIGNPATYLPGSRLPRTGRLYNITEAGTLLGISNYAVRTWILDPDDPLPSTRRTAPGGSRYVLTRETLDSILDSPTLQALRQTHPRQEEPTETGLLTMKQISAATGVVDHFLRARVNAGLLSPVGRKHLGAGSSASMLFTPDVLDGTTRPDGTPAPLPAEWVQRHHSRLLTTARAAKRVGRTAAEVKAAMNARQLEYRTTDGGTRMLEPEIVDAWDENLRTHGPLLTPHEAAQHIGVTYDHLHAAAESGAVASSRTPGGHRRFTAGALTEWQRAGLPPRPTPR